MSSLASPLAARRPAGRRLDGLPTILAILITLMTPSIAPAQSSPLQPFSPNGMLLGTYDGKTTIKVWNYADWQTKPPTVTEVSLRAPVAGSAFRVMDDGSVWVVEGDVVSRYASGEATPQQVKVALPAGTLKASMINRGRIPELVFVKFNYNKILDIRCEMSIEIFTSPNKFCGKINYPFNQGTPFSSAYIEIVAGGSYDYSLLTNTESTHPAYPDNVYYGHTRMAIADGSIVASNSDKRTNDSDYNLDSISLSSDAQHQLDNGGAGVTRLYAAYNKDRLLATIQGSYVYTSADGRLVYSSFQKDGAAIVSIRDLRKADGTERQVQLPMAGAGVKFSPNDKFFLQQLSKPVSMDYLLDPYFGKSKEVVTDVIMARILRSLELGQWPEALQAMGDLEARNSALPEDFYFYQADTLARAGRKLEAQQKANAFIEKYGRKSTHYARMIEILAQ